MATSKTLTPTNQSISIPAMSDAPNMSVLADAISKEADAINELDIGATTVTRQSGASAISMLAKKVGKLCIVSGSADFSSAPQSWTNYDIATITKGGSPLNSAITVYGLAYGNSGKVATVEISANTNKIVFRPLGNTGYTDTNARFFLVYPIA